MSKISIFGDPFCISVVARTAACLDDSLDLGKTLRVDTSALMRSIVVWSIIIISGFLQCGYLVIYCIDSDTSLIIIPWNLGNILGTDIRPSFLSV